MIGSSYFLSFGVSVVCYIREFLVDFLASTGDIPTLGVTLNSTAASTFVTVDSVSTYIPGREGLNGSFALLWGGKQSSLLSVDASSDDMVGVMEELLSAQCEYSDVVAVDDTGSATEVQTFYARDTFETTAWSAAWGGLPGLTKADPFCGMQAGAFPTSFGYRFIRNWRSGGYHTSEFPYMCMAYKIPEGVLVNMFLLVETSVDPSATFSSKWYSATLTSTVVEPTSTTNLPWGAAVASWLPLEVDDEWHHKCINLDEQLDDSLGR